MHRLQKRQFFEKFNKISHSFIHLFESVQRPSRAYFVRSNNRKSPLRGHVGLFLNCVDFLASIISEQDKIRRYGAVRDENRQGVGKTGNGRRGLF